MHFWKSDWQSSSNLALERLKEKSSPWSRVFALNSGLMGGGESSLGLLALGS